MTSTLTQEERAIYEWQSWVSGFGYEGQQRLKGSSVFVSRVGGVGGAVAFQLAAAGVGKLILAHAGNVKPSDLNRQLLVTHDWIGKKRIESVCRRLRELNPRMEIIPFDQNVTESNADELLAQADVIVDCAPLFSERFAMNQAAVKHRKPLVECSMFELEAQLTTIVPYSTPCLTCLYPTEPTTWKREFPVFGAVAGSVGCLAAMEAIKVLAKLGQPLTNRLLRYDLRDMTFQTFEISRSRDCATCGSASQVTQQP